jgi:hypothetical protein
LTSGSLRVAFIQCRLRCNRADITHELHLRPNPRERGWIILISATEPMCKYSKQKNRRLFLPSLHLHHNLRKRVLKIPSIVPMNAAFQCVQAASGKGNRKPLRGSLHKNARFTRLFACSCQNISTLLISIGILQAQDDMPKK